MRQLPPILALLLLVFAGCKQKSLESSLPPATQSGAMTFGCILNSNYAFSVRGPVVSPGGFSPCSGGVSGVLQNGRLTVAGINCPDETYQVTLAITDSPVVPGTYHFGNGTQNTLYVVYQGRYGASLDTIIRYLCDQSHGGTITITRASTVDSIYSGTFSGTLTDGHADYPVTDGRFDVKAWVW